MDNVLDRTGQFRESVDKLIEQTIMEDKTLSESSKKELIQQRKAIKKFSVMSTNEIRFQLEEHEANIKYLESEKDKVEKKINEIEDTIEESTANAEQIPEKFDQDELLTILPSDSEEVKEYKKAKQIQKKSLSDTVADKILSGEGIGSSIKSTFKEKSGAKLTGIKESLDLMNIGKNVGGRGLAAVIGKATGRDESAMNYFANTDAGNKKRIEDEIEEIKQKKKKSEPQTAERIERSPIIDPKTGVGFDKNQSPSIITNNYNIPQTAERIERSPIIDPSTGLGFEKSSYTPMNDKSGTSLSDILQKMLKFMEDNREQDKKEKEEDNSKEQDRQDAKEKRQKELLEAISNLTGVSIGGVDSAQENSEESGGKSGGIMGLVGDVAAGVTTAKIAGNTLSKVSKIAEGAKGILSFLEKIPGLSMIAAGASLIMDVKGAIDDHDAGKIDDTELKKRVVGSVGGALGGLGGAELGGMLGGAIGSAVPVVGTLIGGALGGVAGFFGGESLGKMAAEKTFDFFTTSDATPPSDPMAEAEKMKQDSQKTQTSSSSPSSGSSSAMPTASPVSPGPSSSGTTTPAPAASSPSTVAPAPSPNLGTALNASVATNQDMKIAPDTKSSEPIVLNSNKSQTTSDDVSKLPFPPVRNKESTFERVLYYSTRTV